MGSSRRGAKRKWSEADLQYLEQCLELKERTYNSLQLAHKLCQERQVKLSPDRLRHLLQKRAKLYHVRLTDYDKGGE